MKLKSHIAFWTLIYLIFVFMYKGAFKSYLLSFYFASFLLPVALGTSLLFNYFLVPKYLITKRYKKFILNLVYTIIGAAYLEIIVIYLAFIFLAELDARNMHPSILDVSNMAIMIYAVVFAHGFFETFKKYQHTTNQLKALTIESEKEKTPYLNIRSERQNKRINLNNTLYIESLADYIKIYTTDLDPIVSKQKISAIQEELPKSFLRIHRSFIINTKHISSFTKDSLSIGDQNLTISRTYKKDVLQALNKVG